MLQRRPRKAWALTVTAALIVVAAVAATVPATSPGGATETRAGGTVKPSFVAKVNADFVRQTRRQTYTPPKTGPKAVAGKSIVVIPCAMAAEGCARPARAAMEAAKVIGWEATLIDPAGDPSKMAAAVQKAISLGADGIVLQSIDAHVIQGALQQAKARGIKIVAFASGPSTSGRRVLNDIIPSLSSLVTDGYTIGQAAYKLGKGKARMVMMIDREYGILTLRRQGTERFIRDCQRAGGNCKILGEQNFLITELATRVPGQAVSLARNNPGFNVFWADYDAGLNFMIQGLRQAGITDGGKSFAVSFDANVANLDLIRKNGYQRATVGLPMQWAGYAQIDSLNRMFAGQRPVDSGLRTKLLVKSNVPRAGAWDGDLDVRPLYRRIWGK